MQINQLKREHPLEKEKRIGRGGKRGHYSGKGIKGQKARAGRKLPLRIKDWLKKYHKIRGYKFKPLYYKGEVVSLNLGVIDNYFKEGETVSPEILVERRIIRKIKGKVPKVKILGKGNLTKRLTFKGCLFSEKVLLKVKDLGCQIK